MSAATRRAIELFHGLLLEAGLKIVCELHGVAPEEVMGRGRVRRVVLPRQELMASLWLERVPFAAIGRMFDRDHTTVMYAVDRVLGERARATAATDREAIS